MIIAHNNDYGTFRDILDSSVKDLQQEAQSRTDYYLTRGGINLEKDVYEIITDNSVDTIFQNNIELISGQKFPDIVAYVNESKAYGLEVKTTKANKWKSTGSSIFEGTRVDNVENIHLLFAKLTNPIEFRCRKYDECLYDVAITHSPRYLIDMQIGREESIFSKIGVDYNDLRKCSNPFEPIKEYFRSKLKDGDDLWWIDNKEDNIRDISVKLWGNLSTSEKDQLRITALAYFPNLLGKDPKKYSYLATWLVSRFGVVNHALRDTFSAGGQIEINGLRFPHIFGHIFSNIDEIFKEISSIQDSDIKHYWGINSQDMHQNKNQLWKYLCIQHSESTLNSKNFEFIRNFLQENS